MRQDHPGERLSKRGIIVSTMELYCVMSRRPRGKGEWFGRHSTHRSFISISTFLFFYLHFYLYIYISPSTYCIGGNKRKGKNKWPYGRSFTHSAFSTIVWPVSGERQDGAGAENENMPLEAWGLQEKKEQIFPLLEMLGKLL